MTKVIDQAAAIRSAWRAAVVNDDVQIQQSAVPAWLTWALTEIFADDLSGLSQQQLNRHVRRLVLRRNGGQS
ncbi:MAG: hypothetical protein ACLP19_17090 [Xanthobacteraceae bacterium]